MKDIQAMVARILQELRTRGGLKAVYFVGCGGSMAAIYPGKYLLDAEAKDIPTKIYSSDEFAHALPASLDTRCLVLLCSLKATQETVQAVRAANERGAVTLALTGSEETGMARVGQYVLTYSHGDEQIYSQANQAQVLRVCFELLRQLEGYQHYECAMRAFGQIDGLIADAKRDLLPRAQAFAREYKDDEMFYVLGAGPLWGTAYTMVNCHLIEMQARNACLIHCGEYFHGPFEATNPRVAAILLMSTGRTRPLDERVRSFLDSYAGRHLVLDAAETGIEERLGAKVAEFFNSVAMIPLERFFVSALAEARGRSMDERQYMWKVPY